MSCWRRLCDWQERGVWQSVHFVLLDWLARYGQIDWSSVVVDGSSVRAVSDRLAHGRTSGNRGVGIMLNIHFLIVDELLCPATCIMASMDDPNCPEPRRKAVAKPFRASRQDRAG